MAERVMFIQLKTAHDTDMGPAWISLVRFSKSWATAYWHGKTLRRWRGMVDANFYDVETFEEYWVSGPHRDRADTRYSGVQPARAGQCERLSSRAVGQALADGSSTYWDAGVKQVP